MSPATPTTTFHACDPSVLDSQQAIRLPMGSCPGNARAASASLTIITFWPPRRSSAVNPRPFTIGTRIVAKKSGVMMRNWL
jgi:hypothetical protein